MRRPDCERVRRRVHLHAVHLEHQHHRGAGVEHQPSRVGQINMLIYNLSEINYTTKHKNESFFKKRNVPQVLLHLLAAYPCDVLTANAFDAASTSTQYPRPGVSNTLPMCLTLAWVCLPLAQVCLTLAQVRLTLTRATSRLRRHSTPHPPPRSAPPPCPAQKLTDLYHIPSLST